MELPERIVCAANKYGEDIVLGLRHNDEFMRAGVNRLFLLDSEKAKFFSREAQGFLTNRKRWVTREEAFQIAARQEQIIRKTGYEGNTTLYSEDVY